MTESAARHRPPAGTIGYRGDMASRRIDGRRGRRALGTGAVLATVLLVSTGCGVFGASSPTTLTQTVTVAPSGDAGNSGGDGGTSSGGAPVTVVAPNAVNPSSSTPMTTAADDTGAAETDSTAATTGSDDSATTETTETTTTSTTATTLDKEGRAVARKLATRCNAVLTRSDITRVFGTSAISEDSLRINEEGNPDNGMTARTKCYYGTADLAVARPLVVALAGFANAEAAARQVAVTTDSEKAAGAKATQAKVGGQTVQLLLRDGGFAIVQSGTMTISIAVADGIASYTKLLAALPSLMSAVLKHLG